MAKKLKLVAVNGLVVLVLLFVVDQALGVLGFPSEKPSKSGHRENVSKIVKSIEFEYEFSTNDLVASEAIAEWIEKGAVFSSLLDERSGD